MRDFLCEENRKRTAIFSAMKTVKMILAAEFPAILSSAVKIASERRCAILVHSGEDWWVVSMGRRDPSPNPIRSARNALVQKQQKRKHRVMWRTLVCTGSLCHLVIFVTSSQPSIAARDGCFSHLIFQLSGPALRASARLPQRHPHIPHLRRNTLVEEGYLGDTCATPHQNNAKAWDTPSAIPSRKVFRDMGVSHTGPLSFPSSRGVCNKFVGEHENIACNTPGKTRNGLKSSLVSK